jgi:PhnB protein
MKGINAYLTFSGNCRDAMTFYAKCLGADLHMMTFGEAPIGASADAKDKIMHAALAVGPHVLMASDAPPNMPVTAGNNFSITIACESAAEIDRLFAAVSEGGTVVLPLQETFWGARFGMLKDRFGINWMFNLDKPKAA